MLFAEGYCHPSIAVYERESNLVLVSVPLMLPMLRYCC
jgi:hypothetical protein